MGADPARFRLAEAGPRALRPLTLDSLGHVMSSTAALPPRIARVGVAPIRQARPPEADHDEGRRSLDLEPAVGAAHPGAFALTGALTRTSERRSLSRRWRARRGPAQGQLGPVGSVRERRWFGGLRGPSIGASTISIARGVTPVSRSTDRERTSLSILSRSGEVGSCSSRATKRFSCVRRRADAWAKFDTD